MRSLLLVGLLSITCELVWAQPRLDANEDPLPGGALARLGSFRFRPVQSRLGEANLAVAITPDDKTLATGESGGVRLWDLSTGKETGFIPIKEERFVWLRFDQSGRRLVAISDEFPPRDADPRHNYTLYAGDNEKRKIFWKSANPSQNRGASLQQAWFAANGKIVIAQPEENERGRVFFFDAEDGRGKGIAVGVRSLAVSPDGNTLAAGADGGELRILDVATRKEIKKWKATDGQIGTIAWSPDGKLLAADTTENGGNGPKFDPHIYLWDAATGKKKFEWSASPLRHHLRFSPDGKLLVSNEDHYDRAAQLPTRVWELENGKEIWRDDDKPSWRPKQVALPDGTRFSFEPDERIKDAKLLLIRAESPKNKELWQWWARGGQFDGSLSWWGHGGQYDGKVVSNDGKTFVSSADHSLRVIDLLTSKDRADGGGHRTAVTDLQFTPDGSALLSRDQNEFTRLWKPSSAILRCPDAGDRGWTHVRILGNGSLLFARDDGKFRTWNAAAGRALWSLDVDDYLKESTTGQLDFDVSETGLLAIGPRKRVELWDAVAGKLLSTVNEQWSEKRIQFSPDGRFLCTQALGERHQRLYRIVGGKLELRREEFRERLYYSGFSPDSHWLVHNDDKWLRLHSLDGRTELSFSGPISEYRFTHDGSFLATLDDAEGMQLFSLPSGRKVRSLPATGARYYSGPFPNCPDDVLPFEVVDESSKTLASLVDGLSGRALVPRYGSGSRFAFSHNGEIIAVAGDGVALYETRTGGLIARLPEGHRGRVTAIAFSPDGKILATGGSEGSILTWDWPAACRIIRNDSRPIEALWNDLSSNEASSAFRAIFALAATPKVTVPFLRARLKPVGPEFVQRIRNLIDLLDDDEFNKRDGAMKELRAFGFEAQPFLCAQLEKANSTEREKRIKDLLADAKFREWQPETTRSLRAIQVLELIGTTDAEAVLKELAKGVLGTIVAQESAKRINARKRSALH